MSHYSECHPTLVDEATTQAIFSSMPPSPSGSAMSAKRSGITEESPPEAKKPRYVCLTYMYMYTITLFMQEYMCVVYEDAVLRLTFHLLYAQCHVELSLRTVIGKKTCL